MTVTRRIFRATLVAGLASVPAAAIANPTGGVALSGTVTMQQTGNLLQITNSPNAIIRWNSFSIAANETTRFIQQSPSSAVLNRVVGAGGVIDPSVILGNLQSNGRVFLVNPSGILFGAGAQVDVAGLVATSLNLSDTDFLSGRLRFTQSSNAGPVVNQGSITTESGGGVYLVGPAVTNSGIITSPAGEVILAAGNSVELVNPGTPNLRVEISAPTNEAVNLGQIIARSGRIGIYAGLIKIGGTLNASRAVNGPNGAILLQAADTVLGEGGVILADTITIETGGAGSTPGISNPGAIVCTAGSGGCSGTPPPSIIVNGGGDQPPQNGGDPSTDPPIVQPPQTGVGATANPAISLPVLSDVARAVQQGNGQVVNSLLVTTDLNDSTLLRDAPLPAEQRGTLTLERSR